MVGEESELLQNGILPVEDLVQVRKDALLLLLAPIFESDVKQRVAKVSECGFQVFADSDDGVEDELVQFFLLFLRPLQILLIHGHLCFLFFDWVLG